MIIFGVCVSGDGSRYDTISRAWIDAAAAPDDLVLTECGSDGIADPYNRFLEVARAHPDCEALILVHDDVELIDPNLRSKVLAAVAPDDVGIVGVIGASDIPSIAWWDSTDCIGFIHETRGPIDAGPRRGDCDVVDGLLLVLSRRAIERLRFDAVACPHFYGYDVDICLQARDAGLRVVVTPIDLVHRTRVGTFRQGEFDAVAATLATKWPDHIRPPSALRRGRANTRVVARTARRRLAGLRRRLHRVRLSTARRGSASSDLDRSSQPSIERSPAGTSPSTGPDCLACGTPLDLRAPSDGRTVTILRCGSCGSGRTWPSPTRDVEGDGIWIDAYGSRRLADRPIWFREARQRIEWLQLYAPEGDLLEIGCGTGEFLRVAVDEGYDATGVEVSRWAAGHARELGVEVTTGFLGDWSVEHHGLRPRIVAMWHVLEHVPDPRALLHQIRETMQPDGLLALEVPNGGSVDSMRLGEQWLHAAPDEHNAHFTPDGIRKLLEATGFEVTIVLPFSRRLYSSRESWQRERNDALLEQREWPPLDMLRVVATSPGVD